MPAAYALRLARKSRGHVARWLPHRVEDGDWLDYEADDRFARWFRRYVEGDWDVENGPAARLAHEIELINALTGEGVGLALYDVPDNAPLSFPGADNTWKYEDAHRDLYGILIDGLQMDCIRALSARLGYPLEARASKTLRALTAVLPALATEARFTDPMANVSEQRGRASHNVRPSAQPMAAFQRFATDIEACLDALGLLRQALEAALALDAKASLSRHNAMKFLPTIVRPPDPGYGINNALRIKGKTVADVEVGFREDIEGVHQSEAIIIRFTDGSILGIDTGSNAGGIACEHHSADEFHVDLKASFVPPPR